MRIQKAVFVIGIILCCALALPTDSESQSETNSQPKAKPKLTLDEFFNYVSFDALEISPDGSSVVIGTERADWDQQIFRKDLWLWRDQKKNDGGNDDGKSGSLIQLTQSGHDSEPKWSPDGKWIAFLSDRKISVQKSDDTDSESDAKDKD